MFSLEFQETNLNETKLAELKPWINKVLCKSVHGTEEKENKQITNLMSGIHRHKYGLIGSTTKSESGQAFLGRSQLKDEENNA